MSDRMFTRKPRSFLRQICSAWLIKRKHLSLWEVPYILTSLWGQRDPYWSLDGSPPFWLYWDLSVTSLRTLVWTRETWRMVQCVIVSVLIKLSDTKKSYKFSSFPCLKWSSSQRMGHPNIQHCHICSDHFEPSCFEGVVATAVNATITCNWWNVNCVSPSIPFTPSY